MLPVANDSFLGRPENRAGHETTSSENPDGDLPMSGLPFTAHAAVALAPDAAKKESRAVTAAETLVTERVLASWTSATESWPRTPATPRQPGFVRRLEACEASPRRWMAAARSRCRTSPSRLRHPSLLALRGVWVHVDPNVRRHLK